MPRNQKKPKTTHNEEEEIRILESSPLPKLSVFSLPVELHRGICRYLPTRSLVLLSLSSAYFYKLLKQDTLVWPAARALHWTEFQPSKDLPLPPPPVLHTLADGTRCMMDERRWAFHLFAGGDCYVCHETTYLMPASIAMKVFVCTSKICQATWGEHSEPPCIRGTGLLIDKLPEPTPSPLLPDVFPILEDISSSPVLAPYLLRHPEVSDLLERWSPSLQFSPLFLHVWNSNEPNRMLLARHVQSLEALYKRCRCDRRRRERELKKVLPIMEKAAVAEPYKRARHFAGFEDDQELVQSALLYSETCAFDPSTVDTTLESDIYGPIYSIAAVEQELAKWRAAQTDESCSEVLKDDWRRMAERRPRFMKAIQDVVKWKEQAERFLRVKDDMDMDMLLTFPQPVPQFQWTVPSLYSSSYYNGGAAPSHLGCAHCQLIYDCSDGIRGTPRPKIFPNHSDHLPGQHMEVVHALRPPADIDVVAGMW